MTWMRTWRAADGRGLEGVRLLFGSSGFRALGRLVRAEPDGDFTVSYRLVVGEGGTVQRLSLTSATVARERHLTMNRTEDGYWLLDTGSGGQREDFDGAQDVDVALSPVFSTIPIRRLARHRQPGESTYPVVSVSVPDLQVTLTERTLRTVAVLPDGSSRIELIGGDAVVELTVDPDGLVADHPGRAAWLLPGQDAGLPEPAAPPFG